MEFEYLKLSQATGVNLGISNYGNGIWVSQATGLDFQYFKLREWYVGISRYLKLRSWNLSGLEFEYFKHFQATMVVCQGISSYWAGISLSQAKRLKFKYLKHREWYVGISRYLKLRSWNFSISRYLKLREVTGSYDIRLQEVTGGCGNLREGTGGYGIRLREVTGDSRQEDFQNITI